MTPTRPDISLIVIFHNADSTIGHTLQSLAAQTIDRPVEYLFVDDGSTDRSVEILRQFVADNPEFGGRHRLISLPVRSGTAAATRHGIENAAGRYVMRCDADDCLSPDALQSLIGEADRSRADVVIAPYVEISPRGQRIVAFRHHPRSLNDFAVDTLHFSLWNKLISTDLLRDNEILPFEGLDRWEDLGVVARVMALRPTVSYLDHPVYHYYVDPSRPTLSRSSQRLLLEDHLRIALLVEQWLTVRGLADEFEPFLNLLKFSSKVKLMRGPDKDPARWKHTFPEVNRRILRLRHVPLRYRLLFTAVALLPASLTQRIANLLSRPRTKKTNTND